MAMQVEPHSLGVDVAKDELVISIDGGEAVEQTSLVHALATALGQPAPAIGAVNQAEWPLGDSTPLRALTSWQPRTDPTAGMAGFAAWYGKFHGDGDMA